MNLKYFQSNAFNSVIVSGAAFAPNTHVTWIFDTQSGRICRVFVTNATFVDKHIDSVFVAMATRRFDWSVFLGK